MTRTTFTRKNLQNEQLELSGHYERLAITSPLDGNSGPRHVPHHEKIIDTVGLIVLINFYLSVHFITNPNPPSV